jgi:zinc protease
MKNILLFFFVGALMGAGACTKRAATPKAPKTPAAAPLGMHDFRKEAPPAGPAPKIQIAKAETFTLDNGLKVIVVPNSKLPRVSFQVYVDMDPILEGNSAGAVEMMGELLAKGTTTMSKSEMDEKIDFIGAGFGTSSSGMTGNCLTKHAETLLGIMSDVLMHPAWPEAELKKSKVRQQSNLAQAKDDAGTISSNVSAVLNFGSKHPYGEVMTEETLEKIDLTKVKQYYSTYFKPNISYLVVVGDVTKMQVEAWSKKYFGAWPRMDAPKHSYTPSLAPTRAEVSFVHKPGAVQSVINITYPINLKPGTPDAIPASVMNTLLGGYFNSRLNQNLREGRAFTYGARSAINPDPLNGTFSATASVRNEVTDSSLVEFLKEMNRMRNEGIPRDELAIVKSVMTGNFASSLEKPESIARFALNTARFNLPADYYQTYLQALAAVTTDDVKNMAMKYIQPDRAYYVVVGEKGISEGLGRFSTDKKVRYYDINGMPVVENTVKVPAGLTPQKVIESYITAIGGAKAIAEIKDLTREGILTGAMPMDLQTRTVQKVGGKFLFELKMGPQTLVSQVTDGKKGKSDGMEGAKMLEGEELAELKREAIMVPELDWNKDIYTLLLKGIEAVNGKNAYAVEVTELSGSKTTYYYEIATGLKLREMRTQGTGADAQLVVTDFDEYKAVNGVMFAHANRINGVFPTPGKITFSKITANAGTADAVFEVK